MFCISDFVQFYMFQSCCFEMTCFAEHRLLLMYALCILLPFIEIAEPLCGRCSVLCLVNRQRIEYRCSAHGTGFGAMFPPFFHSIFCFVFSIQNECESPCKCLLFSCGSSKQNEAFFICFELGVLCDFNFYYYHYVISSSLDHQIVCFELFRKSDEQLFGSQHFLSRSS